MGVALVPVPDSVRLRSQSFGFYDDFHDFNTGDLFTSLAADSGASVAASDAAGGALVITTGGTNNNEALVKTTKEIFLVAAGKPAFTETRLKYTEANTDDANVMFGFMDAVGADSMVDDGAGPKTSFSGAVLYKIDGGTVWKGMVSIGSTQSSFTLDAASSLDKIAKTPGGGTYQVLRVDVNPKNSTKADVEFWIDNILVYKITDWTFTSATEMQSFVYAKAGGANSEVVTVDYLTGFQKR